MSLLQAPKSAGTFETVKQVVDRLSWSHSRIGRAFAGALSTYRSTSHLLTRSLVSSVLADLAVDVAASEVGTSGSLNSPRPVSRTITCSGGFHTVSACRCQIKAEHGPTGLRASKWRGTRSVI